MEFKTFTPLIREYLSIPEADRRRYFTVIQDATGTFIGLSSFLEPPIDCHHSRWTSYKCKYTLICGQLWL